MLKLLKIISALLLITGGLVIALLAAWNYLDSPIDTAIVEPVLFEVPEGAAVARVAYLLQDESIIRSALFFKIMSRLQHTEGQIKAGVYRMEQNLKTSDVHRMLVLGTQKLEKVTLPEGFTARQMGKRLEDNNICSQKDFLEAVYSEEIREKYRIPAEGLEGYLYPDTYMFQQKYPALRVVAHLVDTFFKELKNIDAGYGELSPEALHEKIILASIIEREYRDPAETKKMASVFYNRLEQGMRLQSCATVVYVLTEQMGEDHPSSLTYDDLEVESDFNTYKRWGLTPAPISNPGKYALDGAFHPADTDYFYFLLKDKNAGSHVFSNNLKDHNNAYRLYIKN